jgi:hypothetical protein
MYQQEVNQKLNHEVAKLIVSEKIIMQDNRVNEDALGEIFHMLMVINPSIEVYLLDPAGEILAFSAKPGKVKRKNVNVQPIKDFLKGDAVFPLRGDDPRGFEKKKVFTAARIPEEGRLEGYLYVILGGEIYDSVGELHLPVEYLGDRRKPARRARCRITHRCLPDPQVKASHCGNGRISKRYAAGNN